MSDSKSTPTFGQLAGVALIILAFPVGVGSCAFLANFRIKIPAQPERHPTPLPNTEVPGGSPGQ